MPHFEVSEGIARGHPDKIADQISDAILDACLKEDPASQVAVETMVSHDLVAIGGEIIQQLLLTQPIFKQTAFGGHFGRDEFPWESLPRITDLQTKISSYTTNWNFR